MIQEILSWVLLNDLRVVAERNVSNILIFLYAISYLTNKKAVFLVAFFMVEIYGNLSVLSVLTDIQYYLGYMFVYSFSYWVIFKRYHMVKQLIGYGIMLVFQLGMMLDASIYPEDETFIYKSYIYVVMAIHLYIIVSSTNWRVVRLFTKRGVDFFSMLFRNSYDISFFWYTMQNIYKKVPKA